MKKGFTIIELLLVIGIISVLIGITISAVSGSMERAREQKTSALCSLVEQGVATYYAQKDEWPGTFNPDGKSLDNDSDTIELSDSEVQSAVLELVKMSKEGNPMMDVSGLFVAKKGLSYGMDFFAAIKGTKKHPEGIKVANMDFGYPDASSGKFKKFKMYYSPATDRITVSK